VNQTWALRLRAHQPADPGWRPDGARVSADSLSGQTLRAIATDGAGGVFVAWGSGGSTQLGHLNDAGIPASGWSGTGLTIGRNASSQTYSFGSLAPDESGGVWVGDGVNGSSCIPDGGCQFYHLASMSHYNASGSGLGGQSFYNQYPPVVLFADGANGVLGSYDFDGNISRLGSDGSVRWTVPGGTRGIASDMADGHFALCASCSGVRVLRYGPAGAIPIVWQPLGLQVCSIASSSSTRIVSDGASGVVITWLDKRDGTSQLYGQHVGADTGIPAGANDGILLCSAGGTRLGHVLVPSVAASAIEVWQDTRFDGGDIYAQRIAWDGAVPVAYALASANATSERIDLRWYSIASSSVVSVERADAAGTAWQEVGSATSEGSGFLAFADLAVTAGSRYGYRLRLPDGTTQGEAWVNVPIAAQLTLQGLRPNPSGGPLRVAFSLSNMHAARIELFDVSGRRVLARDVGALGAGSHVLDLGTVHVSAGVYLVRLEQDGRALTRRALVILYVYIPSPM
jgi:hypothetical protein